jgi:hypothetical protein
MQLKAQINKIPEGKEGHCGKYLQITFKRHKVRVSGSQFSLDEKLPVF